MPSRVLALVGAAVLAATAAAAGAHHAPRRSLVFKHTREAAALRRAEVQRGAAAAAAAGIVAGTPARASALRPAAFSMTAAPAHPTASVANLTATWSGVTGAATTDWVAIYCVGDALANWLEWDYVPAASVSGSMTFLMFRTTCDLEFRYYHDPSPYVLVGTSNVVSWSGGSAGQPYHVRVAYGDVPQTQMAVVFSSAIEAAGLVMLGTSPGVYDLGNVSATSRSYAAVDSCTAPATTPGPDGWSSPGVFYTAIVKGLSPATRYYAMPMVGGVPAANYSTFVTGKPLGSNVATNFVLYGDMYISGAPGAVETSERVTARLDAGEELDFLCHVGDLSYGEGNVHIWSQWMSYIEPYSGRLPYHVSIGNHEYDYEGATTRDPSGVTRAWQPSFWNGGSDSGGECGVGTDRRFRMPAPAGSNGVFWYSFSVGNVHVVMLSSEHDPSPTAPMGAFLAADLAAVDRALTPWVLVNIHRPLVETEMYPSDYAVAAGLRAIMEPVLLQYKVDVVVAGHYHSFQRSCSVAHYKCVSGGDFGIVHYTTGAAGQGLDAVGLYDDKVIDKTILGVYGYSLAHAPNATALRLTFYANVDNSVRDDVWITK